jgi:hypothetical protein
VIVSVHLLDVGWRRVPGMLRSQVDPSGVPGMTYSETVLGAPLRSRLLPSPGPGRAGLIAAWEDDSALDRFLADHPVAQRLAAGWHVRLEPLRVFGAWPKMPGLPKRELPVDDGEPVAVLTIGRLRLGRSVPFLRASGPAEKKAVSDSGVLASTALAHPPQLVSTFSLWRSAAAMREYAHRQDGAHQAAVKADRSHPFHHESAFIRFRPYASQGSWDGRDPLATV